MKEVMTNSTNPVLGYRFSPPLDVFADVEHNPSNLCFCPSGPPCAPHGLFNVSLCQYGECTIVLPGSLQFYTRHLNREPE